MSAFAALISSTPPRESTVTVDGTDFRFGSTDFGDDYFAVVHPDGRTVLRECTHFATINGRKRPYDANQWSDVEGILRTFKPSEGQIAPSKEEVFALIDARPAVFDAFSTAALVALGLADNARPNSGKAAWEAIFQKAKVLERSIREGGKDVDKAAAEVRRIAAMALRDFNPSEAEDDSEATDPRDVSDVMESLAGN